MARGRATLMKTWQFPVGPPHNSCFSCGPLEKCIEHVLLIGRFRLSWYWGVIFLYLGLCVQFTAAAQLVLLNSGSAHWAIWHHGDATRASPPTGTSVAGPGCRCTASGGCRLCRRHPHRSDGHGDWVWWCALVCCFYSALWGEKRISLLFIYRLVRCHSVADRLHLRAFCISAGAIYIEHWATYSSQSRICENPCPPPDFLEPQAQKKSVQGHRFSCHRTTKPKINYLGLKNVCLVLCTAVTMIQDIGQFL